MRAFLPALATVAISFFSVSAPALARVVQSSTVGSAADGHADVLVTFNEPVCRSAAFAATDWTVHGSASGTHAATADTIPACGTGANDGTALSAVLSTDTTNFTGGETVTVTLTTTGAARFSPSFRVRPTIRPPLRRISASCTRKRNLPPWA